MIGTSTDYLCLLHGLVAGWGAICLDTAKLRHSACPVGVWMHRRGTFIHEYYVFLFYIFLTFLIFLSLFIFCMQRHELYVPKKGLPADGQDEQLNTQSNFGLDISGQQSNICAMSSKASSFNVDPQSHWLYIVLNIRHSLVNMDVYICSLNSWVRNKYNA